MYQSFFNLREMPFSITPDPAYLYMSAHHQEALGHLLYGTGEYGGFVQLTGEVGTGKTTIIRTLLEQQLDGVNVAMIHNPRQNEREFVQSICDELRVAYGSADATLKQLVDALNQHLLQAHADGQRTVLIIDEAQNLDRPVLEQVRLLTNLETDKAKLLRIMLVGQPELAVQLSAAEMRQLASRITARYHLSPLSPQETGRYIRHRLRVAGANEDIFNAAAINQIHRHSRGIPRIINVLCDRALLGAYSRHQRVVNANIARGAIAELQGTAGVDRHGPGHRLGKLRAALRDFLRSFRRPLSWVDGAFIGLGLMIIGALIYQGALHQPAGTATAKITAATAPVLADPPTSRSGQPDLSPPTDEATTQPPDDPQPTPAEHPLAEPPAEAFDASIGLDQALTDGLPLSRLTSALIRLWDPVITIAPGENVCRALKASGLECLQAQLSWDELLNIDRPAILSLRDAGPEPAHLLVVAMNQTRALVKTRHAPVWLDRQSLASVWDGQALLLWRNEIPGLAIGPGSDAGAIRWLRRRLAQVSGQPIPAQPSGVFDATLEADIREFQATNGLHVDGVVGLRTRIALSDGAPGNPSLSAAP